MHHADTECDAKCSLIVPRDKAEQEMDCLGRKLMNSIGFSILDKVEKVMLFTQSN